MTRKRRLALGLALFCLLPPLSLVLGAAGEALPSALCEVSPEVSTQVMDRDGQAIRELRSKDGKLSSRLTLAELSPAVMSRHDRHLLKSTFPVIQRLIEFAASPSWLDAVDAAVDRHL